MSYLDNYLKKIRYIKEAQDGILQNYWASSCFVSNDLQFVYIFIPKNYSMSFRTCKIFPKNYIKYDKNDEDYGKEL